MLSYRHPSELLAGDPLPGLALSSARLSESQGHPLLITRIPYPIITTLTDVSIVLAPTKTRSLERDSAGSKLEFQRINGGKDFGIETMLSSTFNVLGDIVGVKAFGWVAADFG